MNEQPQKREPYKPYITGANPAAGPHASLQTAPVSMRQNTSNSGGPATSGIPDGPTSPAAQPRRLPLKRVGLVVVAGLLLVGLGFGLALLLGGGSDATRNNASSTAISQTGGASQASDASMLELDETKNYGNKYVTKLLPVGDKHYTTDEVKKGYIYMCNANFVPEGQAGAQTRGPWFHGTTEWDPSKKVSVSGSVNWTPKMSVAVSEGKRVVTTNDLPTHPTGVFPVASSDTAYSYDRNPNTISAQSLTYVLNSSPTADTPQCVGGEVGVMLTGVALFNGFDAGGRDAGAWEVQDNCDGHPQGKGEYHYHSLSRCITDVSVGTVIGYALDGFPITGPKVGDNNLLTTDDLDECHGITSSITLDGKKTKMYHYVMTQDFPYSVSCFRSAAIKAPGLPETGGQQTGQQAGSQLPPRPPQP